MRGVGKEAGGRFLLYFAFFPRSGEEGGGRGKPNMKDNFRML